MIGGWTVLDPFCVPFKFTLTCASVIAECFMQALTSFAWVEPDTSTWTNNAYLLLPFSRFC